jgi:L-alanine-DL-glutamate epimerase-like enolase superfamily enzyme
VKITGVRIVRVARALDPPFRAAWDPNPRRVAEATLVFVDTDEGITGVGSGDTMSDFPRYAHYFVGEDPMRMSRHVRVLETLSFHAGRYWPLEAALWDLVGKICAQPVSNLFGGAADRVPAYASTGALMDPSDRVRSALACRDRGFRAIKLRVDPWRFEEGVEAIEAVRDAVGDSMDVMVDINQAWRMAGDARRSIDPAAARRISGRLRDLDVLWLEEPLPLSDVDGLKSLRRSGSPRVAGGEMVRTPEELLHLLREDAIDVYQPDVVVSVGMMRCRMIAELALASGRWFTPHTWTDGGIGLIANLHVTAGVGGGPYLEFPYDPPGWAPDARDFLLAEPLDIDADGYLEIPDRPGLGIELGEKVMEAVAGAGPDANGAEVVQVEQ